MRECSATRFNFELLSYFQDSYTHLSTLYSPCWMLSFLPISSTTVFKQHRVIPRVTKSSILHRLPAREHRQPRPPPCQRHSWICRESSAIRSTMSSGYQIRTLRWSCMEASTSEPSTHWTDALPGSSHYNRSFQSGSSRTASS